MNTFLQRYARQNQSNDSARTFVAVQSGRVVGYYSLCAASVEFEQVPERIRKGLAKHPVPMVLLARLAVDKSVQGQGLGFSLLLDAFERFLATQELIAARGLFAHAKDDSAKAFYEKWGFASAQGLPYHLFLLTKDIRATLETL
ncbi:GNAT family N-acetyltransferase [soil metagenome]